MRTPPESLIKRAAVLEILETVAGGEGVVLTSSGAISWYLRGARTQVSLAADPIVIVIVGRDYDEVIVSSSEAARLENEELPSDVVVRTVPWSTTLRDVIARDPRRLVSERQVDHQLRAARAVLQPGELARYGALGGATARALTQVLSTVAPNDTERSVAASLTHALVGEGADALVVLVAGRDRLEYRHPLPGIGAVGDLAMVVVCARRHGLIANVTRWVGFGAQRADEAEARRRILEVEADFFAETKPGRHLGAVFASAVDAYGRHGFAADEYTKHHQGGPTGYVGRDPRATFGQTDLVQAGQAFAWNPSAPAAKVEDTIVVSDTEPVVLTVDPAWPTVTVRGLQRPDVLWR